MSTHDELGWLTRAVGAVFVGGELAGTAYLVKADRMATCKHVVKDAKPGVAVEVRLPEGRIAANVEKRHDEHDAATLKLDRRASAEPLTFAAADPPVDSMWRAFGFPEIDYDTRAREANMRPLTGKVLQPRGTDSWRRAAIQLRCDDFGMGQGGPASGFSGSPVVVGRAVVGHLNAILVAASPDPRKPPPEARAELGWVDACPIGIVAELLSDTGSPESLARRRPSIPAWYVEPEGEAQAMEQLLSPGGLVTLCGPPGHGKRLFMEHLLIALQGRLAARGKSLQVHRTSLLEHVVFEGGSSSTQMKETLTRMALGLVAHAGGDREEAERVREAKRMMGGRGTPDMSFKRVLEKLLFIPARDVEVLAMEDFNQAVGADYQNAFYGMFRAMAVAKGGPLAKLRMIATTHTPPSEFIVSMTAGSHWNVGKTLFLGDLPPERIADLARTRGLDWDPGFVNDELLPAVGGHPRFVSALMDRGAAARALVRDDAQLFRLFAEELRELVKRLQAPPLLKGDRVLKDEVVALLSSRKEPDERSQERLRAMGILEDDLTAVEFRYPIYERFLRQKWLTR